MFFQGKGHCSSTLPKTNVFPPLLLGWQRLNGQQLADRLQLSPASKGLPARIYSSTKRSTFRWLTCQVVTDIAFQLVVQHNKSILLKERNCKTAVGVVWFIRRQSQQHYRNKLSLGPGLWIFYRRNMATNGSRSNKTNWTAKKRK